MNPLRLGLSRALMELASYPSSWATRLMLASKGVQVAAGVRSFGLPVVRRHVGSTIEIDGGLQLRNWYSSNEMGVMRRTFISTRNAQSVIRIGLNFRASGVIICAEQSVRIGDNVLCGANVSIVDSDFHPIDPATRLATPSAGARKPVTIGNNVFIGMDARILKGTSIGDNCVIGAGAIVSGSYPPNSLIAGNPARVIRTI